MDKTSTALSVLLVVVAVPSCAALQAKPLPNRGAGLEVRLPQIRVFADRGVKLPDGDIGGAVQIYGMRVEPDGSEKVAWKHFLFRFHGLIFSHDYEYIIPRDRGIVYFHYPRSGTSRDIFLKLDRETGEVLKRADKSDEEYRKLKEAHPVWAQRFVRDRPDMDGPYTQEWGPGTITIEKD